MFNISCSNANVQIYIYDIEINVKSYVYCNKIDNCNILLSSFDK